MRTTAGLRLCGPSSGGAAGCICGRPIEFADAAKRKGRLARACDWRLLASAAGRFAWRPVASFGVGGWQLAGGWAIDEKSRWQGVDSEIAHRSATRLPRNHWRSDQIMVKAEIDEPVRRFHPDRR